MVQLGNAASFRNASTRGLMTGKNSVDAFD
jgi:hypothetical protein